MLNFTVGPVMSSQDILEIGSKSSPYFRTPEFSDLMKENENFFLEMVHAPERSRCVFLTSSGTGAMESTVMNVLNNEDRVIVINGGSFGQRFADLCRLHKRDFSEIRLEFGHNITAQQLKPFEDGGYTALLVNMDETSSGVLYDMDLISEFCKKNHILLIVDAISAFITDELDMEKLGAGVVITGSQKALAVPPGVAMLALSEEALRRVDENEECCMYLSLKEALRNGERGQTPFTPAVTTLIQINRRFHQIKESGGIEKERKVIKERAAYVRQRLSELPLEIVPESMSNAVTTVHPLNTGAKEIVRIMKDEYQIWICPNGGEYADTIFRIGHIGDISSEDNKKLMDALADMNSRGLL